MGVVISVAVVNIKHDHLTIIIYNHYASVSDCVNFHEFIVQHTFAL